MLTSKMTIFSNDNSMKELKNIKVNVSVWMSTLTDEHTRLGVVMGKDQGILLSPSTFPTDWDIAGTG